MVLGFTPKAVQLWGDPSLIHTLWTQWCWVAHLCSYNRMHSKGTFGPKVEICRNHHSEPAKMGGQAGDWRCVPKENHVVRHLQTCPVLSSLSCTKTTCNGARCTDIWIVFCNGEIFLTSTTDYVKGAQHVVISPAVTALVFECSSSVPCLLMNNETKLPEICLAVTFLMMAHYRPRLTSTWDTTELFPAPGLVFHALGEAKMQATSGTQNYSTPKIDMGRTKYYREQMPAPVRAYQ